MSRYLRNFFTAQVFILLLLPYSVLAAPNSQKEVSVFDLNGNLQSKIVISGLNWNKIGDFKVADLGTDGIPEIIISAAAGDKPFIKIYRLDGSLINKFLVYPEKYLGGINLTLADLNGDGLNEIITAATTSGGPHIRIFNGEGKVINSFFAFDKNDTGGVNVDVSNLLGDVKPEIIVSSNSTSKVRIFDAAGKMLSEYNLKSALKNGQRIISHDLGKDSIAEILTFSNQNDQQVINIYRNDGEKLTSISLTPKNNTGGINLEIYQQKIYIGAGKGISPMIKVIDSYNNKIEEFSVFNPKYVSGIKFSIHNDLLYVIPEIFPTGNRPLDKYVEIDISDQRLKYYLNGFELLDYPISSGKPSTPTRLGEFQVISKYPIAYGGIPGQAWKMPYFIGFYKSGNLENGIHELPFINGYREGERSLGRAVSHGCVRLAIGPAEELYNYVSIGTKVFVTK
jgi:hypothetical protein